MIGSALLRGLCTAAALLAPWPSHGVLPSAPPESNAQALLLRGLPSSSRPATQVGEILIKITTEGSGNIRSVDTKGMKGIRPWTEVGKDIKAAQSALETSKEAILKGVRSEDQNKAERLVADVEEDFKAMNEALRKENKDVIVMKQINALLNLDRLGTLLVDKAPFLVDEENVPSDLPRFYGRAVIEIQVKNKQGKTGTMEAVVDGINAPLTVGNFLDLVDRGFYNNMAVSFKDESTLLTGDPDGSETGIVVNGRRRTIPMEIKPTGNNPPSYGDTFEESGDIRARPVLPFSSFGTMAMGHPPGDSNAASSQFFFLLFDPIYTPAGLNTLDGNYAVFGYVIDNAKLLDTTEIGDRIISMRVIDKIAVPR